MKIHLQTAARRAANCCSASASVSAFVLAALLASTAGLPTLSKDLDWDKKLESGYKKLSLGDVNEAINTFQDKVKHYPDSAACHTALGIALKRKGKLVEAKSEFIKATESEPTFADSYYELGSMQENDKEWQPAMLSFQKYLQLKPNSNRQSAVQDRIQFCKQQS